MADDPGATTAPGFAALLRRHRLAAGLTQEELAERAGLSVDAVGTLERGARQAPRQDTVALLARALGLPPEARRALAAAVERGRGPAAGPGAAAAGPAPLPAPLSSFVGRQRELDAVAAALGTSRLVTLTGPGGVGKTRLALAAAARWREATPGGVLAVAELAAAADPALVPRALTAAAGVPAGRDDPLDAAAVALGGRRALLLLDNCEHLRAACARAATALLRRCPALTILATSRAPLGPDGEATWPVPPLGLPPPGPLSPDLAQDAEAVRLFVARARAARPGFALGAENAPAVCEVCRRLDGLPLAIELAAARVRALAPAQIAARLGDRFRLLADGGRDVPPHQRTLRATLDWSHDLLDGQERALLRRLGVFAGPFSLEAAEAVGAGGEIEPAEVFDPLGRLVAQSLLTMEERDGEARYWLLETVRAYALERLAEAGDEESARAQLRDWALGLTAPLEDGHVGADTVSLRGRLAAEVPNLRALLDWCERADPEAGARLAWRLRDPWFRYGPGAGAGHFERLLVTLPAGSPLRARALVGAAEDALQHGGDQAAARAWAEEGLALARAAGDGAAEGYALLALTVLAWRAGDGPRRRALHREALAAFERAGHQAGAALERLELANMRMERGEAAPAQRLAEAVLAEARARGDADGAGEALHRLAQFAQGRGEAGRARALREEGLALARAAGRPGLLFGNLQGLAGLAEGAGEGDRAWELRREALAAARQTGSRPEVAGAAADLAALAARRGDATSSASYLAEAVAVACQGDDRRGEAWAHAAVGAAWREAADFAAARPLLEEAVARLRALGERAVLADALTHLGDVRRRLGDAAGACAALEEAVVIARDVDPPYALCYALWAAGHLALDVGDLDAGLAHFAEALAVQRGLGFRGRASYLLAGAARAALAAGRPDTAVRLLAAGDVERRAAAWAWAAVDLLDIDAARAAARAALGEADFDAAWAAGAALTTEEAAAEVAGLAAARPSPSEGPPAPAPA